jgi:hypothetical protein
VLVETGDGCGSSGTLFAHGKSLYVTTLSHCVLKEDGEELRVRAPITLTLMSSKKVLVWDFLYHHSLEQVAVGKYAESPDGPRGEPALFHLSGEIDHEKVAQAADQDVQGGSTVHAVGCRGKSDQQFIEATIVRKRNVYGEMHFDATSMSSDHGISGAGVFAKGQVVGVIQGMHSDEAGKRNDYGRVSAHQQGAFFTERLLELAMFARVYTRIIAIGEFLLLPQAANITKSPCKNCPPQGPCPPNDGGRPRRTSNRLCSDQGVFRMEEDNYQGITGLL